MKTKRLATYILGLCFIVLATLALTTMNPWAFGAALALQVAMFLPEWGGSK